MQHFLDSVSTAIQSMGTGLQVVMTFLISMIPVIELRGAIPIAAHAGLHWYVAFMAAVAGNMLPVPFIILFIRKVFDFLRAHVKPLGKLVARLERRVERKKDTVTRYEFFGLLLFVAIPLPGTGAWTGALIAGLLGMRLKKAIPSVFAGVVIAGLLITLVSYGILALW